MPPCVNYCVWYSGFGESRELKSTFPPLPHVRACRLQLSWALDVARPEPSYNRVVDKMLRRLAGIVEAHIVGSYVAMVGMYAAIAGMLISAGVGIGLAVTQVAAAVFAPLLFPFSVIESLTRPEPGLRTLEIGAIALYVIVFIVTLVRRWDRWRWQRRYPRGHCQFCGYNLTGNTSGTCPECGTTITPLPPARP